MTASEAEQPQPRNKKEEKPGNLASGFRIPVSGIIPLIYYFFLHICIEYFVKLTVPGFSILVTIDYVSVQNSTLT